MSLIKYQIIVSQHLFRNEKVETEINRLSNNGKGLNIAIQFQGNGWF